MTLGLSDKLDFSFNDKVNCGYVVGLPWQAQSTHPVACLLVPVGCRRDMKEQKLEILWVEITRV